MISGLRTSILAIVVAFACKGRDKVEVKSALVTPRVDDPKVLASETGKPPVLLVVGDVGVRVGAAESWAELDAGEWKITRTPGPLDRIDRQVLEDYTAGIQPGATVARLDEQSADLDDKTSQDDPPPPEEEDERAKPARPGLPAKEGFHAHRHPELPSRVAEVQGVVVDGKLDPLRVMIFIAPTAKATKLIEVVRETAGAIAVSHAGKIRPLGLQFMTRGYLREPHHWIEARVSMNGLVIEAVPDAAIEVRDLNQLGEAIDNARRNRGAEADVPVDVLVTADTSVQRMIDVIVALELAGQRMIGLGSAPSDDELARRGHRIPTVSMGQPNAQGDLDKAIIRRFITAQKPKILACYTNALETKPDLRGTVQTQFFITPSGVVASSSGSGVDAAVGNCVAAVIKGIEFPKPKGGGGVQVNYPFTMRP